MSTQQRLIVELMVSLLTLLLGSAAIAQNSQTGIVLPSPSPDALAACVEETYNSMGINSRSLCHGNEHYYDSGGNTNSYTADIRYSLNQNFVGYHFVNGTQSTYQNGGQCVHDIYAIYEGPNSFLCRFHTKGCGFTKEGGHVRGGCSIAIEYTPTSDDIVLVKEYCVDHLFGQGLVPKPGTTAVGCVLP